MVSNVIIDVAGAGTVLSGEMGGTVFPLSIPRDCFLYLHMLCVPHLYGRKSRRGHPPQHRGGYDRLHNCGVCQSCKLREIEIERGNLVRFRKLRGNVHIRHLQAALCIAPTTTCTLGLRNRTIGSRKKKNDRPERKKTWIGDFSFLSLSHRHVGPVGRERD